MNYELAKELKDAGFPYSDMWEEQGGKLLVDVINGVPTYLPTLSELVEACGVEGIAIYHKVGLFRDEEVDEYVAEKINAEKEILHTAVSVTSFEEAVARLWLALNKK